MEAPSRAGSLEEFLSAVLRGAAKILGCGSTALILINEKSQQIRVRLGTMAVSYPLLAEVEQMLGASLRGTSFPVKSAQDSLVYRAWRDRSVLETSSLPELVGGVWPRLVIRQLEKLIGEHRFICVPALSGSRDYGVLMFQKEGRHPYNRQQREVILRYARRIGEILENDLMGHGRERFARLPASGPDHYLFDSDGTLLGCAAACAPGPELVAALAARVRRYAAPRGRGLDDSQPFAGEAGQALPPLDPAVRLELVPWSGGPSGVLCVVDRDDERQGAVSLEHQLLQLTLGEAVPSLFVDPELRITSCNEATEQALGYRPAELVQRPIGELFANRREIVDILSQQILDPRSPYCEEATAVLHRDGSVRPAQVEALLLAGDREQAVGFLVLIRELAEEGGRDAGDRLVRHERLATMGELAAQLAHEMRNPLVAIGATLESLLRDPALAEGHRSILGAVASEIVRMDMTLKDYLAARHDMSFSEVDVTRVMEDARRLLEAASELAGKRVSCSIAPGTSVRADYDALKHVLFNLLLNALEASPQDGEVHCSATADANLVTIAIEDRGPGLAATPAECFRPFFTTKKDGTGLGLAVCQKIARAHGGVVEIRNREGGGCRAAVILPRRAATAREASA